jgi:hypothetical protein
MVPTVFTDDRPLPPGNDRGIEESWPRQPICTAGAAAARAAAAVKGNTRNRQYLLATSGRSVYYGSVPAENGQSGCRDRV